MYSVIGYYKFIPSLSTLYSSLLFLFFDGVVEISPFSTLKKKGKAVPLQTWTGSEGSRKLRFPDFVTRAQDGGRLSALRTDRL